MQTRKHSMLESITNTAAGFLTNYLAAFLFFPLFGYEALPVAIGGITVCYTGLSLIRNYVIRRCFHRAQ